MEMAFQDLASTTSLEDQQLMRQDMEQNLTHYIREHFTALQQITGMGNVAAHILNNLHHMDIPMANHEDDEIYDWGSVDGSLAG